MVSLDIIVPSVIGLVLGVLVAFLFTKYSSVSNTYNSTILGISSNSLVTGTILFILICGIIALVGLSVVIKDTEFITSNPLNFTFELILMAILPTLAFLFVIYSRTGKITTTDNIQLLVLAGKFAAMHFLLQLSGYLRYVFV